MDLEPAAAQDPHLLQSREASRRPALLRSTLACLLVMAVFILALLPARQGPPEQLGPLLGIQVESARGADGLEGPANPGADSAPQDGWSLVSMPDAWQARWPGHDGVVWYRVRFQVPSDASPDTGIGLFLDAVNMAGAVWIDGRLLWQDASLAEPGLTRAWNQSRFFRLSQLRPGSEHVLLMRVTGYAAYAAGIGDIRLGAAEPLQQRHAKMQWWRSGLQQLSLGVNLAVGLLFLMLWLCWPKESLYGWFALTAMAWTAHGYNHIATSVWPLATVPQWQAAMAQLFVLFCCSYAVFVLRFTQQHRPKVEILLMCVCAAAASAGAVGLGWWPGMLAPFWLVCILAGSAIFVSSVTHVAWRAWVTREPSAIALALTLLMPLAAGLHDLAVLLSWTADSRYFSLAGSTLMLMGMAFILAWRLRRAFEREAYFNHDLSERVEAARQEAARMLVQQNDLEVANARYSERLNMVRDLHDGLGGTLVHAIASWKETAAEPLLPQQALRVMEQLRDDLHLIIDSSGHAGDIDFLSMMGSLRHRWLGRLQAIGMDVQWRTDGLQGLNMRGTRPLHVLRFLQEALANVLRHSGARSVLVSVRCEKGALHLVVQDDGCGFDAFNLSRQGMGLNNMQYRARQLNASLECAQVPDGGSRIALSVPLQAHEMGLPAMALSGSGQ